jgi:hypothetical protein
LLQCGQGCTESVINPQPQQHTTGNDFSTPLLVLVPPLELGKIVVASVVKSILKPDDVFCG